VNTFELPALHGHHPLGFLAACGLLRCYVEPGKREAGLGWKHTDQGWVAILHSKELALPEVIDKLVLQAASQVDSVALKWSDKIDDRARFRETGSTLIERSAGQDDPESLRLLPALASDIVVNDKGKLQPTLLDLTGSSQGFLNSLCDLSKDLTKDDFQEALCGPWQYRDRAHSLGWDPQTQRLHALRHRVPEQDKENRSVRGAVFLASQALPLFPCFAVRGRLRTTGFHRDDGDDWFTWPIWREPISVKTLRSLLAQPLTKDLKRRGIELMYRCRRVHTGGSKSNYHVFSNVEEYSLPARKRR
jgi:hypothetical protein